MQATTQPTGTRIGNAWLPPELVQYVPADRTPWSATHQDIEVHGFCVTDVTPRYPGANEYEGKGPELIWCGIYGEGRWMLPEEVMELAEALRLVAHAHIDRVFSQEAAARGIHISAGGAA